MVVDSHVHLLPGRLAARVREFFEAHIADGLAYPLDHGIVCERLAAAGIDVAWSLPYAHKPGVSEGLNAASARTVAACRSGALRVVGGGTVHPGDADPARVVRQALDSGLRVLKLHCSVGSFDADDPRLNAVWTLASEHRLPVVVHAGHHVDGTTTAAELEPLERVATRFPEAPIIIAHCGHHAIDRTLALLRDHRNVYADLTPVVRDRVAISAGAAASVASKLLFGTDAPNVVRTAEQSLADLSDLHLDEAATAAIRGGNAARMLDAIRS